MHSVHLLLHSHGAGTFHEIAMNGSANVLVAWLGRRRRRGLRCPGLVRCSLRAYVRASGKTALINAAVNTKNTTLNPPTVSQKNRNPRMTMVLIFLLVLISNPRNLYFSRPSSALKNWNQIQMRKQQRWEHEISWWCRWWTGWIWQWCIYNENNKDFDECDCNIHRFLPSGWWQTNRKIQPTVLQDSLHTLWYCLLVHRCPKHIDTLCEIPSR